MKKVLSILAVSAFVFTLSSCKKDYTCECSGEGGWDFSGEMKDVKKKDAEEVCDSWNATYSMFGASCELK